MEGSESEKVYEKLNLNPQLFINEAINLVDYLIDESFGFFHKEAAKLLNKDGTDLSEDLELGVNYIRNTIQTSLDKQLSGWEKYCLLHSFAVPSGFSLPFEGEASGEDSMDDVSDEQVEAQLDSLRSRLAEAGKECSELKQELWELETKSDLTNQCAVSEALQLYDNSAQEMFQEMLKVSATLRQKMDQLNAKQKSEIVHNTDLSNMKLDDLQTFIAEMNW